MTQQIMSLLRVILTQNYFTFQQTIYQPNQGIAMRSPISSLIADGTNKGIILRCTA